MLVLVLLGGAGDALPHKGAGAGAPVLKMREDKMFLAIIRRFC